MTTLEPTNLTTLKRATDRGHFDRATIDSIIDQAVICHVGYVVDGSPVVMPTCHWRDGDYLYWHGSRISRTMLESHAQPVCVTITHLDGLVLARSGLHHSANYRSVLVYGTPVIEDNADAKLASLKLFIDRMFPGRWDTLREASRKEMDATTVLKLPLTEASAKVRSGPPHDLEEDTGHPVWAGVIPFKTITGNPEPCSFNPPDMPVPANVTDYQPGVAKR